MLERNIESTIPINQWRAVERTRRIKFGNQLAEIGGCGNKTWGTVSERKCWETTYGTQLLENKKWQHISGPVPPKNKIGEKNPECF